MLAFGWRIISRSMLYWRAGHQIMYFYWRGLARVLLIAQVNFEGVFIIDATSNTNDICLDYD